MRHGIRPDMQAKAGARRRRARQARLPRGLRAAWARLTGAHDRLVRQLAEEARAHDARDRVETQALVERHLAERRLLDRELQFLQAQHALEAEVLQVDRDSHDRTYRPDPRQPLVVPREDVPFTPVQLERQPELILGHIADKKARFSRDDVVRGLAEFIEDPLDLRVALDRALASPDLVRLDGNSNAAFTTRDYQSTATDLANRATEMARSGGFRVKPTAITRAIKRANARLKRNVGASLSDEQVNAIHQVLAPNQLSSVVGLAGTGKSTLLSVARVAWEAQGLRVHGVALAGKAADSLESASGIPSRTPRWRQAGRADTSRSNVGTSSSSTKPAWLAHGNWPGSPIDFRSSVANSFWSAIPISSNPFRPEHRSRTSSRPSARSVYRKSVGRRTNGRDKPPAISLRASSK